MGMKPARGAPPDGVKPEIKPFGTFLLQQNRGVLHEELTEKFHDLVAAVKETGKKGTLTLTLEVALLDGQGMQFRVADKVVVKTPEHDRTTSIFWTDKAGNLTRNDPDMLDLDDLREAEPDLPNVTRLKEV